MKRPAPPFCIKVELTEGCNLRCSFCGIQGIREKAGGPYRYLSMPDAGLLAARIAEAGWTPRVEFTMHGEPTMHPNYVGVVERFRRLLPNAHLMMTSNGGGLLRPPGVSANINAMMSAGLNVLALDDYYGINIVGKIREQYDRKWPTYEYPAQPEGNPHRRRPIDQGIVTIMQDLTTTTKGTHSRVMLNNGAGSAAPKNRSADGHRCARPFRELSIRWDLNVSLCCNDWRGEYKCGSVRDQRIDIIWAGRFFDAARRKLILGERDFGPCDGCDSYSYRVGLLPDPNGRMALLPPDDDTRATIAEAIAGDPYTKPVAREYEAQ